MKQMEFTILGQSYLLACPEGGEALLKAAVERVDHEMGAIRDAGRVKARDRIAVLAALNLAYQLAKTPPQMPAEEEKALIDHLINRVDTLLDSDGRLL